MNLKIFRNSDLLIIDAFLTLNRPLNGADLREHVSLNYDTILRRLRDFTRLHLIYKKAGSGGRYVANMSHPAMIGFRDIMSCVYEPPAKDEVREGVYVPVPVGPRDFNVIS